MRFVQEFGFAPLTDGDREAMLREHIPYRVQLLEDAVRRIPAKNQQDSQAFEAGAVSGRILLSFLGVGHDEKSGRLKADRMHKQTTKMTDDVKVRDVGGRFVELSQLSPGDRDVLAGFIHGAHKACAHFTIGSDHGLNVQPKTLLLNGCTTKANGYRLSAQGFALWRINRNSLFN